VVDPVEQGSSAMAHLPGHRRVVASSSRSPVHVAQQPEHRPCRRRARVNAVVVQGPHGVGHGKRARS
jgi:hypothetical protein